MTTFFTSDLHIGHRFVAGLRGFKEEDERLGLVKHTMAIRNAWCSVVKPDDIVWILGDVSISERTWKEALLVIKDYLPGRKRLVAGNHDPVASFHREAWRHQRAALDVFETVQDYAMVSLAGQKVLLSHYPYSGRGAEGLRNYDGTQMEERYTEFRLADCGRTLLHGHTHGPEKLHFSDRGTPQVHVGLDAWGMRPVPAHEIEKLLLDATVGSAKVDA